jgi:hypothetical protein
VCLVTSPQRAVEYRSRTPERPRQSNALTRGRLETEVVTKLHGTIIEHMFDTCKITDE